MMKITKNQYALWLLIIPLAYVLTLFGFGKMMSPNLWVGWMPTLFDGLIGLSSIQWTIAIGGIELLLAIALLLPVSRRYAAFLISIHMLGVISTIGPLSEIAARDVVVMFAAIYIGIYSPLL